MKMLHVLFLAFLFVFLLSCEKKEPLSEADPLQKMHEPSDEFFMLRAYPDESFAIKAYINALETARLLSVEKSGFPGFDAEWIVRGPGNVGARVNTISVHPEDEHTIYIGFSNGGVYKTVDGGGEWQALFDDQLFLAVGDIAIDPNNPEVVYVGTGDPNITILPFIGNGIFKSEDGGNSWTHLGLTEQRIISKIVIDPTDPDVIYVACMGLPFERNNQRGLYKSTDGGNNWQQVLFVSDQAGIIDLLINPENPQVLYAAAWDRIRNNVESLISGSNAKIFKTINGGDSWTQLAGGLPADTLGRIGLAMSEVKPDHVYAMYVGLDSQLENIYKSTDAGDSWAPIIDYGTVEGFSSNALGGFGWYFGKLRVNPLDENDIFLLGVELYRTLDGGANWAIATPPWWQYAVHADKHDLVFTASGGILLATDGGLYHSPDNGENWQDIERIPTTQFYRVAYNPHQPDWYYGGAQDNGTIGGTALDDDWIRIFGGDGFQAIFHPENPDIFYIETQRGGINVTDDGGQTWLDGETGIQAGDRRNWDMPFIMSAHDANVLYSGTYRLYKSVTGTVPSWDTLSGDLTDGLILHPRFHSISTIFESPLNPLLLYVGTTDGNVWRTDDGGNSWLSISQDLPGRYVTDIKASPHFEDYVYVAHSGYKDNEFIPRIHRSTDRGTNWEDISSGLPDLAINDIHILPTREDSLLFVGTDGGVYGTADRGQSWARLGSKMPFVPVYDLDWNITRNELIAGTFARSIMTFPLDSLKMQADTVVTINNPGPAFSHGLKLFPSPANDIINVEFSNNELGKDFHLVVLNLDGRMLKSRKGQDGVHTSMAIDVSDLPAGIYIVKIKLKHSLLTKTFVKG